MSAEYILGVARGTACCMFIVSVTVSMVSYTSVLASLRFINAIYVYFKEV